jgi:hypothetical protein
MKTKLLYKKGIILSAILFLLSIIFLLFPWDVLNGIRIGNFELTIGDYGSLGSFISGITSPLLSLAAFLLLYLTYQSQQKALTESHEMINKQFSLMQIQKNETTLLGLLNNYNQSIDTIKVHKTKGENNTTTEIVETGRIALNTLLQAIENNYNNCTDFHKESHLKIDEAFSSIYYDNSMKLAPFINNVVQLFKHLDRFEFENKDFWSNVIKAQLSKTEQLLILYYTFSKVNNCQFENEIYKFDFIDFHLIEDQILDKSFYTSIMKKQPEKNISRIFQDN